MPIEMNTADLIARARAGDHDAFRANGQPAFGLYLADAHASVYRAYGLQVITTAGDHITAITCFSTDVMTRFGLPRTLPETD